MRADNSHHLHAAARRRAEQTRRRAIAALRRMDTNGQVINFDTVARQAGVSRSWLYTQPDLRDQIHRLRARRQPPTGGPAVPDQQRASHASLLARLQAATERLQRLEHDNQQLRDALAHALGDQRAAQIRSSSDTPNEKPGKEIRPC